MKTITDYWSRKLQRLCFPPSGLTAVVLYVAFLFLLRGVVIDPTARAGRAGNNPGIRALQGGQSISAESVEQRGRPQQAAQPPSEEAPLFPIARILPNSLMMLGAFFVVFFVPFYPRYVTFLMLLSYVVFSIGNITVRVVFHGVPLRRYDNAYASTIVSAMLVLFIMEWLYRLLQKQKMTNECLNEARLKAESAVVAKNQFLRNISHEIRTPISGIMGVTQMRLQLSPDETEKTQLHMILGSAERLLYLVNNVLDYAMIETGELTYSYSYFSSPVFIAEMREQFNLKAKRKRVLFTCESREGFPKQIKTDRTKLRQIVGNLVNNAISFTEKGSVSVLFSYDEETSMVKVTVADTGAGLSDSDRKTLFAEFEQGDGSLTKHHGGVGLGLPLVKRLVEGLGGEIGFNSTLGEGSIFEVNLPVDVIGGKEDTCTRMTTVISSISLNESGGRKGRVLLAEDNLVNQTYLKHFLEKQSYDVEIASNGEEAVRAYENGTFDAVLMDIQMPKMSGVEATRAIREIEKKRGVITPIIAVTASVTGEDQKHFFDSGMNFFIPKPVELNKLLQCLNGISSI